MNLISRRFLLVPHIAAFLDRLCQNVQRRPG